jgi:hypothetical protein
LHPELAFLPKRHAVQYRGKIAYLTERHYGILDLLDYEDGMVSWPYVRHVYWFSCDREGYATFSEVVAALTDILRKLGMTKEARYEDRDGGVLRFCDCAERKEP